MTAPTPQTLSVDLWNRLLVLGEDDRAGLDRINWQLRKLVKDRPADFDARVTLAYGLLLGGDRDGGMQQIEAARGLWWQSDSRGKYDFISTLVDIGELSLVQELFDRAVDLDFSQKNQVVHNALCTYGLISGNVEWFNRAKELTGIQDEDVRAFAEEIIGNNLVNSFRDHQKLVNSIVGPFSCTFNSFIDIDDTGRPIASARYHTTLIGRERLQLYRRIAELKTDLDVIKVSSFISYGIMGPQIQSGEDDL